MNRMDRYWAKVDRKSDKECWVWEGAKVPKGYGRFGNGSKVVAAHRFGYFLAYGEIPKNMVVHHLCFNPSCQNPKHLGLLTMLENSAFKNRKPMEKCRRGHEFTPQNTKYRANNGARICISCYTVWRRRYRTEKHKEIKAYNRDYWRNNFSKHSWEKV